jgi:penicillin-insensitive murein endopeptidase
MLLTLAGCPRLGVIDDGTSMSYGPASSGRLINPQRLPRRGDGFHIPSRWATRGLNFGTDEMLLFIAHVGRTVAEQHPRTSVSIADISQSKGGPSAWHRSHQTGRDVDIVFFMTDSRGRPARYEHMLHVGADGVTYPAAGLSGPGPSYHFDVARNWSLVRAAIENPVARVQFIFVYDPLRQRLLDYAREQGESADLIAQAGHILRQPAGAAPHDDHFHMRIYCAQSDRVQGCEDTGPLRWIKRDQKYVEGSRHTMVSQLPSRRPELGTLRAMLSLSSLPFRGFVPK